MAFNLGAFAGGFASAGLKTYTTLKEQERAEAAEARDKERFDEEQRQIELRRQAEALQRKAAIPDEADQLGIGVDRVVEAIPQAALYAGNEKGVVGFSNAEVAANEQAFRSTVKGLTPEQQALVLRGYGDQSNAAGQAFEKGQRAATDGKYGIPPGLNAAVVREDAGGGRSVVTADTDEKKTVARYKAMAMASGNPVAIKAANEAELTMLNRQVAEQSIEVGKQNIEKNVLELTKLKDAATFKTKFNTQLEAVTKENNALSLSIEQAAKDPNVTVDSLVKTYGGKIKDLTGTALLAEDGVVYTTDAGGKKIVLASSKEQAIDLLRTNASQYFAQNLSNKVIANGLFENVEAFNTFYERERKYVMDAAGLANSRVMAAAATKNAESAATSAAAAATNAATTASKTKAELDAKIPQLTADLLKAQAGKEGNISSWYNKARQIAADKETLDADARRDMNVELAKYDALSDADKLGPKGAAIIAAAMVAGAKKTGDLTTLYGNITKDLRAAEGTPLTFDKYLEFFGATLSTFKDDDGNLIPISKLDAVKAKAEYDAYRRGASATGSGLSSNAPPPKEPPPKAADTTAKTAIPAYTPPAGSTAAIEVEKRKAVADEKEQATKTLRDAATAAATAAISASSQVDARKVQQMDGFSLLPVAVQAQISQIVNKPVSAIPAAKTSAPAAPAAAAAAPVAAIATTPAQVKAKLEAKIANGDRLSADELNQAKSMGLIKEGGASAAPAAKSINAQREDLFAAMDMAEFKLKQDPNNRQRKAAYETAKEKFEAFKKANKLTD